MATKSKSAMSLGSPRQRSAEEFIEAAGKDTAKKTPAKKNAATAEPFPWEDPMVRDDVIKSVNLRLPEPYILKLQYIAQETRKSQQEIIREALFPAIDAYLEEMVDTV